MLKISGIIILVLLSVFLFTSATVLRPKRQVGQEWEAQVQRARDVHHYMDLMAARANYNRGTSNKGPPGECSGNDRYGCNPHRGGLGLIVPCCSGVCCHRGNQQFGVCRATGPC